MGILKDATYTTRLWFCLVAGFLLSGCVGTPVTFPEVDNKTIGRSHGRAIGAGSCGFQLLLLIPININNRAERAYAELREAAGSDVIADIQVREKWFYGFVGTGYCTSWSPGHIGRSLRQHRRDTTPYAQASYSNAMELGGPRGRKGMALIQTEEPDQSGIVAYIRDNASL